MLDTSLSISAYFRNTARRAGAARNGRTAVSVSAIPQYLRIRTNAKAAPRGRLKLRANELLQLMSERAIGPWGTMTSMLNTRASEQPRARRSMTYFIFAALLVGCNAGGAPALTGEASPPFDAFQASLRLAVGMPQDVAIEAVGSFPVSAEVAHCGVLAAESATCQVLKFGWSGRNRLDVYVEATEDGRAIVSGWLVQKG